MTHLTKTLIDHANVTAKPQMGRGLYVTGGLLALVSAISVLTITPSWVQTGPNNVSNTDRGQSSWIAIPFAAVLFIAASVTAHAGPLHDAVKDGDIAAGAILLIQSGWWFKS